MKPASAEARPYHHGDLRRALIDAALSLVTEEQDWSFSLREVARRAGVSHNAPYNHFPEKRDLLGAVAAVGFEKLLGRMLDALGETGTPDAALGAVARAYLRFAIDNPALYRLMFGPALAEGNLPRLATALAAGAEARAVLEDIIRTGAGSGVFSVDPEDRAALERATLTCWSAVHGLASLVMDAKAESAQPLDDLADGLIRLLLNGLRRRSA